MRILVSTILLAFGTTAAAETISMRGSSSYPESAKKEDPTPNMMCAVMELHRQDPIHCKGTPDNKAIQFSVFGAPGSPCQYTKEVPGISIKDVYCDETGFHETAYQGSKTCDAAEGRMFPVHISTGGCLGGIKFVSCTPGPCDESATNDIRAAIPLEVLLLPTTSDDGITTH